MIRLPKEFQKIEEQGRALLEGGAVRDIIFAWKTYQVQVIDSGEEYWPFLSFDRHLGLADSFCSCDMDDSSALACPHLVAAYIAIHGRSAEPIHRRFFDCVWNLLCHMYAEEVGYETSCFSKLAEGHYISTGGDESSFFVEIQAKSPERSEQLRSLFEERVTETEDSSLKFSGLSSEEMDLWREGRPSPVLMYELSFWSDLAKMLLVMEDKAPPKISFEELPAKLPRMLRAEFEDLSISFKFTPRALSAILPALQHANTSIPIFLGGETSITGINYYPKEAELHLSFDGKDPQLSEDIVDCIEFDAWTYHPVQGFRSKQANKVLTTPILHGAQLAALLEGHQALLRKHLDIEVHPDPLALQYDLSFDAVWALHITPYLFTSGDLQLEHSSIFGTWVHVEGRGFYKISTGPVGAHPLQVNADEVDRFVERHRRWLDAFEGFRTSVAALEAGIRYEMGEEHLRFYSDSLSTTADVDSRDFGDWVYLKGKGFIPKARSSLGTYVRPGIVLSSRNIGPFIDENFEECEGIKNFFYPGHPLESVGLHLELLGEQELRIIPNYVFAPTYEDCVPQRFGNYLYLDKKGFYPLPPGQRLPEAYSKEKVLRGKQFVRFMRDELPHLDAMISSSDPRLQPMDLAELDVSNASYDGASKKGFWSMELAYHGKSGEVLVSDLAKAAQQGQEFFFSEKGYIDFGEARFSWLRRISSEQLSSETQEVQLSSLEFLKIYLLEDSGNSVNSDELLPGLEPFIISSPPSIKTLKSKLRSYQQEGLEWLWKLYCYKLSGLLCDDMGLGKTHQSMALMAAIDAETKNRSPFLVICPTSVIYHWKEKLALFLPHLNVRVYHGGTRSLKGLGTEVDVLLTSYGVSRRDTEVLRQIPFELVVMDEVQVAKNHQSKMHKALLGLQARMRLGLTGTPIENQLRELKALFDLVVPGYMPGDQRYKKIFSRPIEKDKDPAAAAILSRFVKPFVLRRLKEKVLEDLPEKTEEISHCGLLPSQQRLYDETLKAAREPIIQSLEDDKAPVPYLHIFQLLSSLKQICNHPAVYYKDPMRYRDYESGKWELFVEILNQARESQQKVVVFSHYLDMLDIIQHHLKEKGIEYATIRGSTINRHQELFRFREDQACEVFVGSLQAVGLGVDLTAASVVIHYDRWWSAAKENQATDRVHRIGQTRGVQVFKLVTLGTFEERIDELISEKAKLMESIIDAGNQDSLKQFDRKDLLKLLHYVAD